MDIDVKSDAHDKFYCTKTQEAMVLTTMLCLERLVEKYTRMSIYHYSSFDMVYYDWRSECGSNVVLPCIFFAQFTKERIASYTIPEILENFRIAKYAIFKWCIYSNIEYQNFWAICDLLITDLEKILNEKIKQSREEEIRLEMLYAPGGEEYKKAQQNYFELSRLKSN